MPIMRFMGPPSWLLIKYCDSECQPYEPHNALLSGK
jgi:hypothetical protein